MDYEVRKAYIKKKGVQAPFGYYEDITTESDTDFIKRLIDEGKLHSGDKVMISTSETAGLYEVETKVKMIG